MTRNHEREKNQIYKELNIALDRNHYLVNRLPAQPQWPSYLPDHTVIGGIDDELDELQETWKEV